MRPIFAKITQTALMLIRDYMELIIMKQGAQESLESEENADRLFIIAG